MSALVIAAAPILEPLTASIKPAGKDERKTAEAAAPTSANIEVGYSDVFVGRVPRSLANSELQRIFDTEAIPVRYHGSGKGKHGFARLLVRSSEIDRALNLDSAVFGHKFRVAKWKQRASEGPGPSLQSHAQGRQSRGQRYSNVASEKTAELRMNSALRDMRWLLKRLTPPSNSRGRSAW